MVIDSGDERQNRLAIAYNNRGFAYPRTENDISMDRIVRMQMRTK